MEKILSGMDLWSNYVSSRVFEFKKTKKKKTKTNTDLTVHFK